VLIPITLDRDQPLQRQLYDQLRELVTTGHLQSGTRMPSTRMLAEQFNISRMTVLLTYERLIGEGYLETKPASGTFVGHPPSSAAGGSVPVESLVCRAMRQTGTEPGMGSPDPSLFPAGRWRGLMREALDGLGAQVRVEHPGGSHALRHAVAQWLSSSRGLSVSPDQVVLLNSRKQALHVAAHLGLRPAARAVVEDPCDSAAAATLASEATELVRVPVDGEGLCTDHLPSGRVGLVHVTPEHQQPLGATMTYRRRLALLDWAARSGALVLEEDCEGELRYGDVNLPSLMSLDTAERVMLLGGFGVSLGPWLRLSYLAVPRRLAIDAAAARHLIDDSQHTMEESALAELITSGFYARHLHRLGKTYVRRRDALLLALRQNFGETVPHWGGQAGLHLAWFPPAEAGPVGYLADMARRCGLEAIAVPSSMQGRALHDPAVLLGFGALPEEQIAARIGEFARRAQAGNRLTAMSAD
jgi:GntR family transcriptional regulator/MocR family aminotransferase